MIDKDPWYLCGLLLLFFVCFAFCLIYISTLSAVWFMKYSYGILRNTFFKDTFLRAICDMMNTVIQKERNFWKRISGFLKGSISVNKYADTNFSPSLKIKRGDSYLPFNLKWFSSLQCPIRIGELCYRHSTCVQTDRKTNWLSKITKTESERDTAQDLGQ